MKVRKGKRIDNERRYINDLIKNGEFMNRVYSVQRKIQKNPDGTIIITPHAINKAQKIAKKYKIIFEEGTPLWDVIVYGDLNDQSLKNVDKGIILHRYARLISELSKKDGDLTIISFKDDDPPLENEDLTQQYPIVIAFKADISQTEMFDFIQQNWDMIKQIQLREQQPKRERRLRVNERRDELIWKTRNFTLEDSYSIVRKKYPNISKELISTVRSRLKERSQNI